MCTGGGRPRRAGSWPSGEKRVMRKCQRLASGKAAPGRGSGGRSGEMLLTGPAGSGREAGKGRCVQGERRSPVHTPTHPAHQGEVDT